MAAQVGQIYDTCIKFSYTHWLITALTNQEHMHYNYVQHCPHTSLNRYQEARLCIIHWLTKILSPVIVLPCYCLCKTATCEIYNQPINADATLLCESGCVQRGEDSVMGFRVLQCRVRRGNTILTTKNKLRKIRTIKTIMDGGRGTRERQRGGGWQVRDRKKEMNQNAMCPLKISWCYVLNIHFWKSFRCLAQVTRVSKISAPTRIIF